LYAFDVRDAIELFFRVALYKAHNIGWVGQKLYRVPGLSCDGFPGNGIGVIRQMSKNSTLVEEFSEIGGIKESTIALGGIERLTTNVESDQNPFVFGKCNKR
jgi:hypothetical protein